MTWPPSDPIILDTKLGLEISPARAWDYTNELGTLAILATGLHDLFASVQIDEQRRSQAKSREERFLFNTSSRVSRQISAVFQWYALSLTNYVDVVKHIGVSERIIADTKRAAEAYRADALGPVLAFRNKVAAHPARARRNKDDHGGDRLASVTAISAFVDGLWVCPLGTASSVDSAGHRESSSEVRMWSITRTHQSLTPRFWPQKLEEQAAQKAGDSHSAARWRARAIENTQIPLRLGLQEGSIAMPLSLEIADEDCSNNQ